MAGEVEGATGREAVNAVARGVLIIVVATLAAPAHAIDRYICVGDRAGGVHFEAGDWKVMSFDAAAEKYLVGPLAEDWKERDEPKNTVGISALGSEVPVFRCEEPSQYGSIWCEGLGGTFRFSTKTLRFVKSYLFGYVEGDVGKNDPSVVVGRCSKM